MEIKARRVPIYCPCMPILKMSHTRLLQATGRDERMLMLHFEITYAVKQKSYFDRSPAWSISSGAF